MYTTRTTLLEKIAAGDEIAWSDFFNTYKPLVRSIASDRGVPLCDIDEIMQMTMLGTFHEGKFIYRRELHGKFRTWFGGIVRHKISDYFHARKTENEHLEKISAEASLETSVPPDFETCFVEEYRNHLLNLALEELKKRVDPEIFETFALCRTGCSDKEAACKLGVKSNTVTIRKRRCTEIMNEIIRRLNETDPELSLPPL